MPDKLYFVAPQGSAPQLVRGKLSELSNMAYGVIGGECQVIPLQALIGELRLMSHYEGVDAHFRAALKNDFYRACVYWDELYRFEDCWPIIDEVLDELGYNRPRNDDP